MKSKNDEKPTVYDEMRNNTIVFEDNFIKKSEIKSAIKYGEYIDAADFTLCIPIFGIGEFLEETLYNVRQFQKACSQEFQILISNNSGKLQDNSIISNLINKLCLDNVIYFNTTKELGQLNNFNRCISLCRTSILVFLHDDDLLSEDYAEYIERLTKFMEDHEEVGMVHEKYKVFYDTIEKTQRTEKYYIYELSKEEITHYGSSKTGIPSCGMVIRRSAATKAGGFCDRYPYIGDQLLSIAMMDCGYSIFQSNVVNGYYRLAVNMSSGLAFCRGLIFEGALFRQYWFSTNILKKCYYKVFERYFYSRDIDYRVSWFSPLNKSITVEALDYKSEYKHYKELSIVNLLHRCGTALIMLKRKFNMIKLV